MIPIARGCLLNIYKTLYRLGFRTNTYNETILTLSSRDKVLNSLPVGIIYTKKKFKIKIYSGTQTYLLLKKYGEISPCICVSNNPVIYYYSVFEKNKLEYCIIDDYYCISGCEAYVLSSLERVIDMNQYLYIYLEPRKIIVRDKYPKTIHRSRYAVIEALIYYTKTPFIEHRELDKIYQYMEHCRYIVNRSSQNSIYNKLFEKIYDSFIEKYHMRKKNKK